MRYSQKVRPIRVWGQARKGGILKRIHHHQDEATQVEHAARASWRSCFEETCGSRSGRPFGQIRNTEKGELKGILNGHPCPCQSLHHVGHVGRCFSRFPASLHWVESVYVGVNIWCIKKQSSITVQGAGPKVTPGGSTYLST